MGSEPAARAGDDRAGGAHHQECPECRCRRRPHPGAGLRTLEGSDTLVKCGSRGPAAPGSILPQPLMTSPILDSLRERILFYDGGMGTQLLARGLSPDDF